MAVSPELTARAGSLFRSLSAETEAPTRPAGVAFDAFDPEQVKVAALMGLEMAIAAEQAPDDEAAVDRVLATAEAEAATADPGLVRHALALFATHSRRGRLMRKPRMMRMMPSAALPGAGRLGLEAATGAEAVLDYWREDPLANEHHQHWHEVYPGIGVQRPIAEIPPAIIQKINTQGWEAVTDDELRQVFRPQDRHGELFVYMHQQMLARYDAERLAHDLAPVTPLDQDGLEAPIPEGFEPGPSLNPPFVPRPERRTLTAQAVAQLTAWQAQIREAIAAGAFANAGGGETPITPAVLGDQLEAVHAINRGEVDQGRYGNLHNAGHGALARAGDDGAGVMNSTVTAIRDPVFYRWHRLIDNLAAEWQATQPPLDLAGAPPVTLAGAERQWAAQGILLLDSTSLPPDSAEAAALATALLGGDAWAEEVPAGAVTGPAGGSLTATDTLTTRMKFAAFPDPQNPGQEVPVPYLAHDGFTLALRLENLSDAEAQVTVRSFLCPAERAEDRRAWVELDKFPVVVPARARVVVLRGDTDFSVVKKPAESELRPDLLSDEDGDPRCDCGWPYTLLLPRGTEAGAAYRLLVALTDAAADSIARPGTCGSLSFCGARDPRYPDRREMGWPFHRRWNGAIGATAAAEPSIAGRSLTIRHVPFGVG